MLMVSLLNHEYCLGQPQRMRATLILPVIAIQYQALVRLTTAAEMMFLHCPIETGSKDRESNLKCVGSITAPQEVAWQKESLLEKLRRQGLQTASLVPLALPLLYPDTREALLRPKLVRKADEDIE